MQATTKPDWIIYAIAAIAGLFIVSKFLETDPQDPRIIAAGFHADSAWTGPSLEIDGALTGKERELVAYGQELIANTSYYLGPKGILGSYTNGMNCQNCHLDAGTRAWGNNYGAVFSTYPKFRERSGHVESVYKRVADCMERSLNGRAVDSNSREFQAIYAYIKWLGTGIPKGVKPVGSGIEKLPYLDRAASPGKGKTVYLAKCSVCHGAEGAGMKNTIGTGYQYPPLWGDASYNDGAGLYRVSTLAGYIRNNMPFNIGSHASPGVSVEEAWDLAAFINSNPRPHKDQQHDWPDHAKKPVDFPFAPYADSFTEQQHKYGPFAPIVAAHKKS